MPVYLFLAGKWILVECIQWRLFWPNGTSHHSTLFQNVRRQNLHSQVSKSALKPKFCRLSSFNYQKKFIIVSLRDIDYSTITMIKNFKPQMRLFSGSSRHKSPPAALPYIKSEQSSNDYIASLCKQKHFKEALKTFDLLGKTTFQLNLYTYACLISACATLRYVEDGRKIHNHIRASGSDFNMYIQNHILNMYGKCRSLKDARKVFDEMEQRNLVSWTSMIAGYSQSYEENEAIKLYLQMLETGLMPDQFTFGSIIKACSGMRDLNLGKQLHVHVIKSKHGSHLIAQNALVAMYTKFDQLVDALDVFSRIGTKDIISWGSIISAFSKLGYELEALRTFKEMHSFGTFDPNQFIFGSVFSACSTLKQPKYGGPLHGISIKYGLQRDNFTGCSLCDMYAKCGYLDYAKSVFYQIESPDLVSWNTIIAACSCEGNANEAISLFSHMRHMRLTPDEITVRSLLCSFLSPSTLHIGQQVHSYIMKMGYDIDVPVCNTLLTMYSKCSDLSDAFKMLKEVENSADVVSWNAILTACMQHDQAAEVLRLLKLMVISQNKPDYITLSSIFAACIETASLEMGKQVHCYSVKTGLDMFMSVLNGLIDMYSKCGSVETARNLFGSMENPDVVSWSSLIVGYAQCGYAEEALKLFKSMQSLGVEPNEVTIVGVLTACSHVGLVDEGLNLYKTMEIDYGILPTRVHCSCIVDLLARAGCIKEAEEFIYQMPFNPDIVVWKILLAACKNRGNVEIGKRAVENILKFDPYNSAAHVLLCNLYASSGNRYGVSKWRRLINERGIRKVAGKSWIEVKDKHHVFVVEDILHPDREEIFAVLDELFPQMLDAGYEPLWRRD